MADFRHYIPTLKKWEGGFVCHPNDSTDAYNRGDKVRHNDAVWVSDVDGNVWEPGVYGWTAIV